MQRHSPTALLLAGLATAALTGGAATAAAQAPDTNERTKVTIDEPIEVPNATLQPGTYWFQLIDSRADQNTVTIQNEAEDKTLATVITVPIYRQLDDTHGDTELVLSRTEGPGVAAIDAWFFPGKQYGHQFVYPKEQAQQIADRTKHVVLADADGKVMRIKPGGMTEPWEPDTRHAQPLVAGNDAKGADRADDRAKAAAPAASQQSSAVGTSGTADRPMDHAGHAAARDMDHAAGTMDAEAHLEALSSLIDKALTGSGSTLSIDRATLQQMQTHVQQLQSMHEKMQDKK